MLNIIPIYFGCGICFFAAIIIIIRNKRISWSTSQYSAATGFILLGIIIVTSGGQINSLRKTSNFFKNQLRNTSGKLDNSQKQVRELSKDNLILKTDLKEKIDAFNNVKTKLLDKLNIAKTELAQTKRMIVQLSDFNINFDKQVKIFSDENENLKSINMAASKSIASALSELYKDPQKTQRELKNALSALKKVESIKRPQTECPEVEFFKPPYKEQKYNEPALIPTGPPWLENYFDQQKPVKPSIPLQPPPEQRNIPPHFKLDK